MSVATVRAGCAGIERSRLCGDLSRAEMFRQCFRDSAYHRDRVIAVARSIHLGDAPMSDYLRYPSHRVC